MEDCSQAYHQTDTLSREFFNTLGSSGKEITLMRPTAPVNSSPDRPKSASRKVQRVLEHPLALLAQSGADWIAAYLRLTIQGVRSEAITQKITLHLQRFQAFLLESYGHDRLSTCVRRD